MLKRNLCLKLQHTWKKKLDDGKKKTSNKILKNKIKEPILVFRIRPKTPIKNAKKTHTKKWQLYVNGVKKREKCFLNPPFVGGLWHNGPHQHPYVLFYPTTINTWKSIGYLVVLGAFIWKSIGCLHLSLIISHVHITYHI